MSEAGAGEGRSEDSTKSCLKAGGRYEGRNECGLVKNDLFNCSATVRSGGKGIVSNDEVTVNSASGALERMGRNWKGVEVRPNSGERGEEWKRVVRARCNKPEGWNWCQGAQWALSDSHSREAHASSVQFAGCPGTIVSSLV